MTLMGRFLSPTPQLNPCGCISCATRDGGYELCGRIYGKRKWWNGRMVEMVEKVEEEELEAEKAEKAKACSPL